MPNMKSLSYSSKDMAKVKDFRYVGQLSWSRLLDQNFWHDQKGLITRNIHVKNDGSTSCCSKVMTCYFFKCRSKVMVKVMVSFERGLLAEYTCQI